MTGTGNIFPKTTKSGEYDSAYRSNTDGDTGNDTGNDTGDDEDNGNDIEQQIVRPVIATEASPDQGENSKEVTMQN